MGSAIGSLSAQGSNSGAARFASAGLNHRDTTPQITPTPSMASKQNRSEKRRRNSDMERYARLELAMANPAPILLRQARPIKREQPKRNNATP
jgi:hypothetical protein